MPNINIRNKKATFNYEIIEKFTAGIKLTGTEIKSVRKGKVSLVDAYCYFRDNELYAKGIHIAEYEFGTHYNHEPRQDRKLLLTKRELKKLSRKSTEKGLTIIVLRMFINERGWAKAEIALGRGKAEYDKREAIKRKDLKRDLERMHKL